MVKQGGKSEVAQTLLVMRGRTELAASADTPRDALAPMTPSRGVETAADDTCPIAITWVAVTGAVTIRRVAVAGAVTIRRVGVPGAVAITIRRVAVAGAVAVAVSGVAVTFPVV
jgi:hypothetical protein